MALSDIIGLYDPTRADDTDHQTFVDGLLRQLFAPAARRVGLLGAVAQTGAQPAPFIDDAPPTAPTPTPASTAALPFGKHSEIGGGAPPRPAAPSIVPATGLPPQSMPSSVVARRELAAPLAPTPEPDGWAPFDAVSQNPADTTESALSKSYIPLLIPHPGLIETAADLMTDHGMAADAGKIDDVISKHAHDHVRRTSAPPNLTQRVLDGAPDRAAGADQAPLDGEPLSGDSVPQSDGTLASGEALRSDDASAAQDRAQPGPEPASTIAEGEERAGVKFGTDDATVAPAAGKQPGSNDPLYRSDRFEQASDSPSGNSGGSNDGDLLQDLRTYASRSIEALSRIPGGLARLTEEFTARPIETTSSVASSFPQTKVQGELLSGTTSILASILANAARGNAFETAARNALQLAKNTKTVEVPGIGRSIPDSLIRGVTEIKSGLEIDNSVQLRVQAAYAAFWKLPFNLIVAPTTRRVSKPVEAMVNSTRGTIQRFDPATGLFGPFP